jgi:hypothetical protein
MFRCPLCSCVVGPRTPPQRLLLERRTRSYPYRSRANEFARDHKRHVTDDPGGNGSEVVREVLVCPECARRHAAK